MRLSSRICLWKSGAGAWIGPRLLERQPLGQCRANGTWQQREGRRANQAQAQDLHPPADLPLHHYLPAAPALSLSASRLPFPSCCQLHAPGLSIPKLSFFRAPPSHTCLRLFPSHGQPNSTFLFHSTNNHPTSNVLLFVCGLRIDKTFSSLLPSAAFLHFFSVYPPA